MGRRSSGIGVGRGAELVANTFAAECSPKRTTGRDSAGEHAGSAGARSSYGAATGRSFDARNDTRPQRFQSVAARSPLMKLTTIITTAAACALLSLSASRPQSFLGTRP